MFCRKCGAQNEDGAKFCKKCGTPLMIPSAVSGVTGNGTQNNGVSGSGAAKRKSGKKAGGKWLLYVALVLILLAGLVAGVLFAQKQIRAKKYHAKIKSAQKYIEELDYEKAETEYLALIEIDPKQEEPYLKLADIYVEQSEPEKAKEILARGVEATHSEVIEKKYSYYEYLDKYLIGEEGRSPSGTYELSYRKVGEYGAVVIPAEGVSGLVNYRIMDFDHDGEDEILALMIETEDKYDLGYESNYLYLRMYENVDGKFQKSAEYCSGYVLGTGDGESGGVFLKCYGEEIYICGGMEYISDVVVSGYSYKSFALNYDGEEFRFYAGWVSTAHHLFEDEAKELAGKLESIGLPKAAAHIEKSLWGTMTYEDEVDAMLFRVEGENVGGDHYWEVENPDINDLGKVVLQYWIDTVQPEEEIKEK